MTLNLSLFSVLSNRVFSGCAAWYARLLLSLFLVLAFLPERALGLVNPIVLGATEAEVSPPMELVQDFSAIGIHFLHTSLHQAPALGLAPPSFYETNKATWRFNIPVSGNYIVWCHMRVTNSLNDSLYVWANNGEIDVFSAGTATNFVFTNGWQWVVCHRSGSPGTARTFFLNAGTNSITFRGREAFAGVDQIIIKPQLPPLNDAFVNSEPITNRLFQAVLANFDITTEPGEPNHASPTWPVTTRSQWWNWTAPESGILEIKAGSYGLPLDTVLSVYEGNSLQNLSFVGNTYYFVPQLFVTGGVNYKLAAASSDKLGAFWSSMKFRGYRQNDHLRDRVAVVDTFIQYGNNQGASTEQGETGRATLWWSFRSSSSALYRLSGLPMFSTPIQLRVFKGSSIGDLVAVGTERRDAGDGTLLGEVLLDAKQNEEYLIQVGSAVSGLEGPFAIECAVLDYPPYNDSYENASRYGAYRYGPAPWREQGSLLGATVEPGEINLQPESEYGSIWWIWGPEVFGGAATITATLPTAAPDISVFSIQGGGLTPVQVAAESIGLTRQVRFPVASSYYAVALSGRRFRAENIYGIFTEANYSISAQASTIFVEATNVIRHGPINGMTHFIATLRAHNSGDAPSGRLRVRLVAEAGRAAFWQPYERGSYPPPPPERVLDTFEFTNPPSLLPGQTTSMVVSGYCPAATNFMYNGYTNGYGWGVFAVLEEEIGSSWLVVDNPFIVAGIWPKIGEFAGPGGGAVRLDPYLSGLGNLKATLTSIIVHGVNGLLEGRSSKYYATARFSIDNTSVEAGINFTNTAWTSSIQGNGFKMETNGLFTTGLISEDQVALLSCPATYEGRFRYGYKNVFITNAPPPFLSLSSTTNTGNLRMTLSGVPGRTHRILTTTNLARPNWTTSLTVVATSGPLPINSATNFPEAYYKVRESLPP